MALNWWHGNILIDTKNQLTHCTNDELSLSHSAAVKNCGYAVEIKPNTIWNNWFNSLAIRVIWMCGVWCLYHLFNGCLLQRAQFNLSFIFIFIGLSIGSLGYWYQSCTHKIIISSSNSNGLFAHFFSSSLYLFIGYVMCHNTITSI